jgi:transposase-like protein
MPALISWTLYDHDLAADGLGLAELRADRHLGADEMTKRKVGQPTKYDPAFIPVVINLVARGLTNYEIADTLNVDERTLYNWRREHEEFAQALQRSKDQITAQVEASLLMKANGYERKVQKATASGKVVTVTEYFPPSDSAIQFWLRNQKASEYREQKDINVKHGVEQGFLTFLSRLDDKARQEREGGQLPPLLESVGFEDVTSPLPMDDDDEDLVS